MNIHSLLNPLYGENNDQHTAKTPAPAVVCYSDPPESSLRRMKVAKDAPIFSDANKIVGFVNYPPHESDDSRELASQLERFHVFPRGEIYKKGVRHIPYNSDKKDFLEKTGREAFEMFQYTYKIPGEDKEYVVVWDYNVGLVRMTPFFKSCKFTKTVPAKALNQNPGMKDISYSITGGALVCQGYWMPYQAARAIAATFCYSIRWALTPVFGYDFPSMCLSPKNPGYAKFLIDPAIVRQCTAETDRFRREGTSYRFKVSHLLSPMETPKMHFEPNTQNGYRPNTQSGYSPQSEVNDNFAFSPHISPRWNPINRPRTPNSMSLPATPKTANFSTMSSPLSKSHALPSLEIRIPIPDEEITEPYRTKRTHSKVAFIDIEFREHEEDTTSRPQTAGAAVPTKHDMEAAQLLLSLGGGGTGLHPPTKRTRRGSTM
ncbi:hypothetical protein DE146DRAFT_614441 [Phaeosphaeria sp. MPI-PUGE-AT-0046c]|nr:hypothetical protein DE146DRAFT_614441 [Phaeosphaeria sp. MPI-PUGE-AT-0046c]